MALAAAVAMMGQSSAYGLGAAGHVVVGSGTISPGLTTVPTNQSFTFTTGNLASLPSVAAGVSTNGGASVVTLNCVFNGNSTIAGGETSAAGLGVGSGSCTTATGVAGTTYSAVCSLTYIRVGPIVIVVLVCVTVINGNPNNSGTAVGAFLFVPTSVNPTTSYQLAGAAALALTNP
jgi:hypothetical protein